ncbi:MAG: signal peptidase I [Deltaproteobacteria bacterium]
MDDAQRNLSSLIFLVREANREITLDIQGTSMLPFFEQGDRITVKAVAPGKLRTGDVILFRQNEQLIAHRLIWKKRRGIGRCYCQKGDHLSGWSWISGEDVLGRVTSFGCHGVMVEMTGFPWKWINMGIGVWGAGCVALGMCLTKMKNTLPGVGRMSFLRVVKRVLIRPLSRLSGMLRGGVMKAVRGRYIMGRLL